MKKLLTKKSAILLLLFIILLIQFIGTGKPNPVSDSSADYIVMVAPPAEVSDLIRKGCYDCHSNETKYPWYSKLAPVSWLIRSHIIEGRNHLNFSEWGNYQAGRRGHITDECREMLESKEMPLNSYKLIHKEARFSNEQREMLKKWFTVE